jgi:hypothetical protein
MPKGKEYQYATKKELDSLRNQTVLSTEMVFEKTLENEKRLKKLEIKSKMKSKKFRR